MMRLLFGWPPDGCWDWRPIADALIDGDADAIREILLSHLEQVHKDHFYKDAGISRRALFKLMEPNANPTLESLAKVCKALAEAV